MFQSLIKYFHLFLILCLHIQILFLPLQHQTTTNLNLILTTMKGYEALTMLTRTQQRKWYNEIASYGNLEYILLERENYDIADFILNSFPLNDTKHGQKYWENIINKYSYEK